MRMRILLALSAGALLSGCSAPMTPRDAGLPQLRELRIEPSSLRPGGALVVRAVPADDRFPISSDLRIPVSVRTSSGDREEILLRPELCRTADGTVYICDTFYLAMHPGQRVTQLSARLEEIGGRFGWISSDGQHASVQIFRGDLQAIMRVAAGWPGVRWVELSGIGTIQGGPTPGTGVRAAAPFEYGAAAPGDGEVQVSSGGTLTVEYRQPDGEMLVSQAKPVQ